LELMQLFGRGPGPWIKPIKDYLTELVIDGDLEPEDKEAAIPIAQRVYVELGLDAAKSTGIGGC
jgi:poly(A) polymerase